MLERFPPPTHKILGREPDLISFLKVDGHHLVSEPMRRMQRVSSFRPQDEISDQFARPGGPVAFRHVP
jgi:hypothetical protein